MNNFQKHINKMNKADLEYLNWFEEINPIPYGTTSYYKNRKKLKDCCKGRLKNSWEDFKKFSEWVRE